MLKSILLFLNSLLGILLVLFLILIAQVKISPPLVDESIQPENYVRKQVGESHYEVGANWLKKNKEGIWEMYIEGSPYERGVIYGVLAKEIIESQEDAFVNQIDELVPGTFFQRFLQIFIALFNRDMDEHVPSENLQEIYGISKSFSPKYTYIGPHFYRILYYHAAHDIGHALADLRIVGCTSFAAKNSFTEDGELLLGRNFDFYMGEAFAKDKLLLFVKPTDGYGFATYSWAGFTGVVSGMNEKGLSVTLNASKSDIPTKAKTPISLLAREILQYASTIDEAVTIAEKHETFVSESLLIGSKEDNSAAIIEKSPSQMDVVYQEEDQLVCANHYQGQIFGQQAVNIENINFSDSKYRYDRMQELLGENKPLNPEKVARVLRNKNGLNDKKIGLGNPKAINQMIAHHGVIFKPLENIMWVSTAPYQMGDFVAYDVSKVIESNGVIIHSDSLNIAQDDFINTQRFADFKAYKKLKEELVKSLLFRKEISWDEDKIQKFIALNPESYEVYNNLGWYFETKGNISKAKEMYALALTKEIASLRERNAIEADLKKFDNE